MEICNKCSIRAAWECECFELLCFEHKKIHKKEASGHIIQKIQLYWASDAQHKASKRISNQLKSLEHYYHRLMETTSNLMEEIRKLTKSLFNSFKKKERNY